ncbi:hypothetical protein DER44DRAFT_793082 [Fusarium oxysporum]|nr:hypothetical protein DER44DRAFT_793082 [Fusarium oxysporum]
MRTSVAKVLLFVLQSGMFVIGVHVIDICPVAVPVSLGQLTVISHLSSIRSSSQWRREGSRVFQCHTALYVVMGM